MMTDFPFRVPGAFAVFRIVAGTPTNILISQLARRERWVLLLIDGRRTIADLARLTHRGELDIASTLDQFLQWGYIEPVIHAHIDASTHGT